MRYYKLTNQNLQTYGGFQWELLKWEEASGDPTRPLCTDGWFHCCDSPLLVVLHNPIHANIANPRLFEVEVAGDTKDENGMKHGFRKMRIVKELPVPEITLEQRVRYGILCAKAVCTDPKFVKWADCWLSGEDRTQAAAQAAARAAEWTTEAAATARATQVAAVRAAVWATEAAVAAEWTTVARASEQAIEWVAWAAARATEGADKPIDLIGLAEQAVAK
jgi:hypothetical protein